MIIDFHTHAFPDKVADRAVSRLMSLSPADYIPQSDGTISGLLGTMDKWNIDVSLLQPVITNPKQFHSVNLWAKEVQSDRIRSFGGIHPDTQDYKGDIDFICELGLKGIKLHPEYQGFTLNEPKMMRIYEYAFSRGLMILFHAGDDPAYPPPYHSHPRMFAQLVKEFPGATIIAAHLGGINMWPDVEKYLCGLDIYLDTSAGFGRYGKERFMRILKLHGADKLLFGTDAPWNPADREINSICSLPISQEEKEAIFHGNAQKLLGI